MSFRSSVELHTSRQRLKHNDFVDSVPDRIDFRPFFCAYRNSASGNQNKHAIKIFLLLTQQDTNNMDKEQICQIKKYLFYIIIFFTIPAV